MKAWMLLAGLLCGDITPSVDDRFQSENKSPPAATEALSLPLTISREEATKLQPRSPSDLVALSQLDGQAATIEGQVHSVYIPKSGSPVILNLGPDFKTCLKAVIYDRHFRDWNLSAAEIGQLYDKQTVVIEGQVTIYKELPQVTIPGPKNVRVVR